MNLLKRLNKLLLMGAITEDEYLKQRSAYEKSRRATLQTAEGIIAFLESELNEALELHDKAKEHKDMEQALVLQVKAHTISGLLEEIKA